jgi:group II intron reverse transcriptase/maturase
MDLICTMENLNEAFLDVRANRGCAGSDGVSIAAFDKRRYENLAHLQSQILHGSYQPVRLKLFSIPKADGSERVLRVPSVRDRVAQQAVLRVIGSLWEAEFEASSYAYRKGRSVKQAIKKLEGYHISGRGWVLRADVKHYFDEIPHDKLIQRFSEKIKDEQLIALVRQWMLTGDGDMPVGDGRGIPQGSAVSPLLSNIYLDRFDEAVDALGYKMVRYADDFAIACKSEQEAEMALDDIRRELKVDALQLNEEKTCITSFRKGFMFLGYVMIGSFAIPKGKLPAGWRLSGG